MFALRTGTGSRFLNKKILAVIPNDLEIALLIDQMSGAYRLTYTSALNDLILYLGLVPAGSILLNINLLISILSEEHTYTNRLVALNALSLLIGGSGDHLTELSAWIEISAIGIVSPTAPWILEDGTWNFNGRWTNTGLWNN